MSKKRHKNLKLHDDFLSLEKDYYYYPFQNALTTALKSVCVDFLNELEEDGVSAELEISTDCITLDVPFNFIKIIFKNKNDLKSYVAFVGFDFKNKEKYKNTFFLPNIKYSNTTNYPILKNDLKNFFYSSFKNPLGIVENEKKDK